MFQKITTRLDATVLKKIEEDPSLARSTGFHECFILVSTIIVAAHLDSSHAAEWDKYKLPQETGAGGNKWRIAKAIDPSSSEGGWFRNALECSSRLEVVIEYLTASNGETYFHWELFAFRTSAKSPHFSLRFTINLDGVVRGGSSIHPPQ